MNTVSFPVEYQQVMPYLILPDPGGFLQFAKEVLGAEEKSIARGDSGEWRHCEVIIGTSVIMFSQTMDGFSANTAGLFVYVPDADAAYARAIALGAESISTPGNQPYGRSCGVRDGNGNTWWLTSALH